MPILRTATRSPSSGPVVPPLSGDADASLEARLRRTEAALQELQREKRDLEIEHACAVRKQRKGRRDQQQQQQQQQQHPGSNNSTPVVPSIPSISPAVPTPRRRESIVPVSVGRIHTCGGRVYEWDGAQLSRLGGNHTQVYTFDGMEWKPTCHDASSFFEWDGRVMRPADGDLRRAIEVRGDSFWPYNGNADHAWDKRGCLLRKHNGASEEWFLHGEVPLAVVAAFIACVLNGGVKWAGPIPEVRQAPASPASPASPTSPQSPRCPGPAARRQPQFRKRGSSGSLSAAIPSVWGEAQGKCAMPLVCRAHAVEMHASNPVKASCEGCGSIVGVGDPVYRSCACRSKEVFCGECAIQLQSATSQKVHKHPMYTVSRPLDPDTFECLRKRRCAKCKKPGGAEGAYCVPCAKWFCVDCCGQQRVDPCGSCPLQ